MTDQKRKTKRTVGLWRDTWRRYRRYKFGIAGLAVAGTLFLVAIFAPTLANDEPLVCSYEGSIYFPAIVETFQNIPLGSTVIKKSKPFRFESFSFKDSYDRERGDKVRTPFES